MANIDTYLAAIRNAIYGEQVRTAICNAISAINTEVTTWTGLQDGSVTTSKIYNGAVTQAKLSSDLNTMINAMKTGFDGVVYSSPAAMVQGSDTTIMSTLNAVDTVSLQDILNGIEFEKGTIIDGEESANNTRIRSDYIDVSSVKNVDIHITEGFKYVIFFYTNIGEWVSSSIGSYYATLHTTWQTSSTTISLVPLVKYIRVVIANTSDSSAISILDKNKLIMDGEYGLYNNLFKANQSGEFFYNWLNGNSENIDLNVWSNGVVDATSGSKKINTSSTRIWSGVIEIPTNNSIIDLSVESGYQVAYYFFGSDFSKIRQSYWHESISLTVLDTYKYVVIALSKTDGSSISPSDGVNVHMSIRTTNAYIQNVQTKQNITENANIDLEWEIGTLNPGSGTEGSSTKRIRSRYIFVGAGTRLRMTDSTYYHLIYTYDLSKTYVSDISFTSNDITVNEDCYIRILIRKRSDAVITSEEVSTIAATEMINRSFPQVMIDTESMDEYDLPSYFTENLDTAMTSIKENVFNTGINGDTFVFLTDVHWQSNSKWSPTLIRKIIDKVNIDKIICGGDLIGGGAKSNMITLMNNCIDAYKDITRFYVLLGNHDLNTLGSATSSDYFSKSEAYALMQKQSDFIMDYGSPCYFYFDNPTTKTRYICLDTGLEGTTLDTTQREWIDSTLSSCPDGWHILVFAHIIYQTTTSWHIGLQPSELAMTSFMTSVCGILDDFNANSQNKKVEAIFGGHVHIDCNFETTGGIPIVLTDCDARQTYTTDDGTTAKHTPGTVNEQCFDVISIDYNIKTIECVRVGRSNNRTITY